MSQPGSTSTSAMKRSLDLGQVRQTSVPPPAGPRQRQGVSPSPMLRPDLSAEAYPARQSLDGRLPSVPVANGWPRHGGKQSAPASSPGSQLQALPDEDLKRMLEVLPNADPTVLKSYLERFGGQMEAIR
jgi:hypothetical protein